MLSQLTNIDLSLPVATANNKSREFSKFPTVHKNILMHRKLSYTLSSKNSQVRFPITGNPVIVDKNLTCMENIITPFWNNKSLHISKKLWLPDSTNFDWLMSVDNHAKIFSIGLYPNLSSLFPNKILPKVTDLVNETHKTNNDEIKDSSNQSSNDKKKRKKKYNGPMVTRRIRWYPTAKQAALCNIYFGTSRFIYNKGVDYLNAEHEKFKNKIFVARKNGCIFLDDDEENQCCSRIHKSNNYFCKRHMKEKNRWRGYRVDLSLMTFRNAIITKENKLDDANKWQKNTPYDTKQFILNDLITAYKSAVTNKINDNIDDFKLEYKSRKNTTQIFHIDK